MPFQAPFRRHVRRIPSAIFQELQKRHFRQSRRRADAVPQAFQKPVRSANLGVVVGVLDAI